MQGSRHTDVPPPTQTYLSGCFHTYNSRGGKQTKLLIKNKVRNKHLSAVSLLFRWNFKPKELKVKESGVQKTQMWTLLVEVWFGFVSLTWTKWEQFPPGEMFLLFRHSGPSHPPALTAWPQYRQQLSPKCKPIKPRSLPEAALWRYTVSCSLYELLLAINVSLSEWAVDVCEVGPVRAATHRIELSTSG